MNTADGQGAAAPNCSRRIYVLWGAGFAFLAALGAFCWLVVGPVMEVKRVIESSHIPASCLLGRCEAEPLVAQLGGQERASRKLALYLRASALTGDRLGDGRERAAVLLGHCGKWGLARIIPMLDSSNWRMLDDGALGICGFFGRPTWWEIPVSGPDREKALNSLDPETRDMAVKALSSLDRVLEKVRAERTPAASGP